MPEGLLYREEFLSQEDESGLLGDSVLSPAPQNENCRARGRRSDELRARVSLAGTCRMRFRRYPPQKGAKVFSLDLAARSVYVLRDEIRWRWQHSVARTKELRYSITFRTSR